VARIEAPVTLVIEEIEDIFRELGFTIALGPEAETEWYNFTALNFPPITRARSARHALPGRERDAENSHIACADPDDAEIQARPFRILSPGNAYRRDFFDASHAPMFAQIEGLAIDEGVSFVDLKATLTYFANKFFGKTKTRFSQLFPFTEPSAEMDV